jgi:regulator of protease activity HflC (stomatin/prohibitin superfamily)
MNEKKPSYGQEKLLNPASGFGMLTLIILVFCASLTGFILACIQLERHGSDPLMITVVIVTSILFTLFPCLSAGLKIINPNESAVFVLFGRYYGTIAKPGFFFINPFCVMVNPAFGNLPVTAAMNLPNMGRKKVSLKATTLSNDKQKINDREGNPIEIGVVVIWRVLNPTKAVFEVDNYKAYVSTQCDAAIRDIARQYPYDVSEEGDEKSLRGSSNAVADELKKDLQGRVSFAGIEIMEARIAHLAYAPEIAAAMLQRQQASAVIAARQKIVEGAVGMVEMALNKLSEQNIVTLDDERKAAMVSNLLVVLCGNRDAQPIVNSGSIY